MSCQCKHCKCDEDGDRQCKHMNIEEKICSECRDECYNISRKDLFYGQCLYCIMLGKRLEIEWDSFDEVVGTVSTIYDIGYQDGYRGLPGRDMKKSSRKAHYDSYENIRKLYDQGYETGHRICESELEIARLRYEVGQKKV